MKKLVAPCLSLALSLGSVFAHCQIPCGIFGDDLRLALLEEHATTIEKSMNEIEALSSSIRIKDVNQLVRWVHNKEEHATEIHRMVEQYFLSQRIPLPKEGEDKRPYYRKLELLHQILVHAMRCKQSTDRAHVKALREAIHAFAHAYKGK